MSPCTVSSRPASVAPKAGAVGSPQKSASAGEVVGRLGQALGLGVVEHLQPVLERAVGDVGVGERGGGGAVDPALVGERGQRGQRLALAQLRVAAADDELAGLGEELDLADAALAELEVVAGHPDRAGEALVGADAAAHVLGVLDRGEVEVAAPDERAEALEEAPRRRRSRRRRGGP